MDMNNKYKIVVIPPALIPVIWDNIYSKLLDICELSNNEMTPDTIETRVNNGDSVLVAIILDNEIECVLSLEVVVYDSGLRSLLVPFISGKGMNDWFEMVENFCVQVAKSLNCTEIRGMAVRDGWARFLKDKDYKQSHVVFTKQIGV